MDNEQPKKLIILNILDILRKYTDENHTLSQRDIRDILKNEYNMTVDRKAIRRNLINLMECGYEIEYSESVRTVTNKKTGDPEESCIWSDFWLVRDFTDSELRLLIDSVTFSNHIPYGQRRELIEKLEGLSNKYFRSHMKHVHAVPDILPQNGQLFSTIDKLDEAINRGCKVKFHYLDYGTDKKLHKKCCEDGTVRDYVISPYQMAANEGKYYLICNYDKYDDISNYRIDRIADVVILENESVRPFESLKWAKERRLDLSEYMREHIYMYSSGNVCAKFRINRAMISDVIDVFGMDVRFSDETEKTVTVRATVNELAMLQFARSFAPDVVLLEPEYLAEKVKETAAMTVEVYENSKGGK